MCARVRAAVFDRLQDDDSESALFGTLCILLRKARTPLEWADEECANVG